MGKVKELTIEHLLILRLVYLVLSLEVFDDCLFILNKQEIRDEKVLIKLSFFNIVLEIAY